MHATQHLAKIKIISLGVIEVRKQSQLFFGLALFLAGVTRVLANGLPISNDPCQSGITPNSGCTIDSSSQYIHGNEYNLIGDVLTSKSVGVNFNTVNSNTLNMTGNITTSGIQNAGIYLNTSNSNVFNLYGNISTTGSQGYGVYLLGSSSNNVSIIGDISTSGDSAYGLYFGSSSTNSVSMNGNILVTGSGSYAIFNDVAAAANSFILNGTATSIDTNSYNAYVFFNEGDMANFIIGESGGLTGTSSNANAYGVRNNVGTIALFSNAGTIQASTDVTGAYGISNYWDGNSAPATITNLTNSGSIVASALGTARAISNRSSDIGSLINTGYITASVTGSTAVGISNHSGTINILNNNGTISATAGTGAYGIENYGTAAVLTTLTNRGVISATATTDFAYGVYNDVFGTITTFTNTGTISATSDGANVVDIYNLGAITKFNNLQSGVSYEGSLPSNYNIIINSSSRYGQLDAANATGSMSFGIYGGDAEAGVSISTGTYSSVITGVDNSLVANESIPISIVGDGVDSVGSATATLSERSGTSGTYDLSVTGTYTYFNKANTQTAIANTAYQLGGIVGQVTGNMNFAHMTTYDCEVYGAQGGCISVGGRYTDVTSPDGSSYGAVVVGGYKLNDQFRVGAFLDKSLQSRTQNIDLSMHTPMVGFNMVWNQHPTNLGLQVKLANTFQSLGADISRTSVGSSQLATGNTNIQAQSYIAEVAYRYSPNSNILFQPLAALRYTRTKMDGYTEDDVSAPIRFDSNRDRNTTLIFGLKTSHQVKQKLSLGANLGYEKDIRNQRDELRGSISGMTSSFTAVDPALSVDKTRFFASLASRYTIDSNQQIEATAFLQQNRYNDGETRVMYVNYSIGF